VCVQARGCCGCVRECRAVGPCGGACWLAGRGSWRGSADAAGVGSGGDCSLSDASTSSGVSSSGCPRGSSSEPRGGQMDRLGTARGRPSVPDAASRRPPTWRSSGGDAPAVLCRRAWGSIGWHTRIRAGWHDSTARRLALRSERRALSARLRSSSCWSFLPLRGRRCFGWRAAAAIVRQHAYSSRFQCACPLPVNAKAAGERASAARSSSSSSSVHSMPSASAACSRAVV